MDWEPLIAAATEARQRAYAPYSGYRVGAALLTAGGRIVAGCNVENRLLGLSVCAERVAVCRAVAEGALAAARAGEAAPAESGPLAALAVITDASPPAAPCGLCRETLAEFAADLPILLVNLAGERDETTLVELLPRRFELPG